MSGGPKGGSYSRGELFEVMRYFKTFSGALGAEPPATFLRRSRPGVWAVPQLPAYMIQLPVWSAGRSQTCLNPVLAGGLRGPERSEDERSEAEDRIPPSQTGFRQIWRRSGESKPVARLNHDKLKVPSRTLATPLPKVSSVVYLGLPRRDT